jgi:type IV fimbrial biogenesis protein FimT
VTLIELMMGIAVLAILGALALPAMGARMDRQRLALAAETLAADLTEARFEAARRGQSMQMNAIAASSGSTGTSVAGQAWCWSVAPAAASPPTSCSCAQTRSCGYRAVPAEDHPGVKLKQGRQVLLTANGQARAATAAVFESASGERLQVDMLALGRARICSPSGLVGRYPAC